MLGGITVKKIVSLCLALVIMMTLLAVPAMAEQKTISVWHRWSGGTEAALLEVIDMFKAAHPEVEVEVTAKSGEYFELLQSMIADAAAGNPLPDVFIGGYNLLNYIATELKPNTLEELAPSKEALDALYGRFGEGILDLAVYGGKQIGLPYALSVMVLYCNMDVFAEAGLTEEDIPTTWEKAAEVAKIITEKTGKIGMQIHNMQDAWADQALIFSNEGVMLNEDKTRTAFDNENTVAAIKTWQQFYLDGTSTSLAYNEIQSTFIAGNVGMYASSIMAVNTIIDQCANTVKVAKTPAFEGKNLQLPSGGAALISFTRDTGKFDAVWSFIDYLTDNDAMKVWAAKSGYVCPTTAEVEITDRMEEAYASLGNSCAWECWPGGSVGLEIDSLWINTRNEILWEGKDVAETLAALSEECNMMLENAE